MHTKMSKFMTFTMLTVYKRSDFPAFTEEQDAFVDPTVYAVLCNRGGRVN